MAKSYPIADADYKAHLLREPSHIRARAKGVEDNAKVTENATASVRGLAPK
jgi:hypothetical protein